MFSYEETRLAFRNHGFHLEFLDRPITPVASHFQLIHFDVPTLEDEGYTHHAWAAGWNARSP